MSNKTKSLADKLFPEKVEEDIAVINIPPEERRLHTETYDFSISTIYEYLRSGDIFIPEFQRKYVWSRAQASRLIESLIIQCPIPVIYLNQERSERLSVIDGNQRLTSVRLFLDNDFELKGLTAYPELDGSRFSDLDPRFRRHIQNRTLRCITILKETHPQIKFDVFERLNTGSVRLNYQELRHGLYHGPLINLIDEMSKENLWREVSRIRSDPRMKGSELILRYFGLSKMLTSYTKPMSSFLNKFCERNTGINEEETKALRDNFFVNIEKAKMIFGSLTFRVYDEKRKPLSKSINAAVYDATMVALNKVNPSIEAIRNFDNTELIDEFYDIQQEEKFSKSISLGTSATTSVKYRIKEMEKLFRKHLV